MERNVLTERLMNKDDKNRHFVLLIIDISKHGAKEMGHVKMAYKFKMSYRIEQFDNDIFFILYMKTSFLFTIKDRSAIYLVKK